MKFLKILSLAIIIFTSVSATSRADLLINYTDGSPVIPWPLPDPQGGATQMAMLFTNPTAVECTLKFIHAGLLNDPGLTNDTTGNLQFAVYSANAAGSPDSLIRIVTVPNTIFVGGFKDPLNIVSFDISPLALTFPPGGQWLVSVNTDPQSVSNGQVLIFASDEGAIPSQRWYEFTAAAGWQRANCCHGSLDVNMHIYSTISTPTGNQPPIIEDVTDKFVDEGQLLEFQVFASDPDSDLVILDIFNSNLPPGEAIFQVLEPGVGKFSWPTDFNDAGVYFVIFGAYDGKQLTTDSISITVKNLNRPPVLTAIGNQGVNESINLSFVISALDPDGTIPNFTSSTLPGGSTFVDNGNGTASFNWTPTFAQAGDYTVIFRATDSLLVDTELVKITVVDVPQAPVLAAIGNRTINENVNLNFNVSATDIDGAIPSFTTSTLPVGATFVDNSNGSGTFSWTPTFAQSGVYPVTFRATDGALTDTEVIQITVNNVNRPPVLNAIGNRAVNEGVTLNFAISGSDPDGTTPNFTSSTLPGGAALTDNGNGTATFDWTPTFAQSGVYPITIRATDGALTDSEIIQIVVNNVNRPPVLNAIGNRATNENQNLNFNISAGDPDGTIPVLTSSTLPLGATFIDNADGTATFNWTPNFAQAGVYPVTCRATDGALVDTEIIQITVNNVNQAPVLNAIGNKLVSENVNLNFEISATDPDGTTPSFTTSILPAGASFTDNLDGTGNFDWTPSFSQLGVYNITFRAVDGALVDTEIVQIIVSDVNRPPVLNAIGDRVVDEDVNLNFTISAADSDGTTPDFTSSTLPSDAALTDNGNGTATFNWTPTFAQSGVHPITFRATDGALTDSEVIQIVVNNVNQAPQFDKFPSPQGIEDSLLTFQISATDIDGNLDSIYTGLLPKGATFIYNGNGTGTFSWTPDCDQSGRHLFVCFAEDDSGAVDTGSILVDIAEQCNVSLTVVNTPCLTCAPPQFYTDILISDSAFSIEFNNTVDSSSVLGNIFFSSARGLPPTFDFETNYRAIKIRPSSGQFYPIDTIRVTLSTGIVDVNGTPLDSTYNLTYLTGPVVYPGDCNNDGAVNEIDVLSIGLFWNNSGPNRVPFAGTTPLDFVPQPAHFQEQGKGNWAPHTGVYSDVDGSGIVDANDLCGIAINFAKTVGRGTVQRDGNLSQSDALSQVGSKVLEQMRDALIECPDSAPKTKMLEAINNALSAATAVLPTEIELSQNYPNPFNPATTIEFYLPNAEHAKLEIYNLLGQRVVTLVDENFQTGYKSLTWDGTDYTGKPVSSGIYFYRLKSESREIIKRMLLIK